MFLKSQFYELFNTSHTGISCRNFLHSTIIPPQRVSWVSREADKVKEQYFVCLVCCFSSQWNNIHKPHKNHQNPLKSYCFWGYFQSLFNFGRKTVAQTHKMDLSVFWHPGHPQRRNNSRDTMVLTLLLEISDLWRHLAIFFIISKIKPNFPFIGFIVKK